MRKEEAFRALATMERCIDMAQAKGVLHRNNAARRKRELYALAARAMRNDAKA
ncbi:30S ribosomal protein S20 [Candidatus Tremblaya princeps]|uniref:Small ribosomal subunit protein bS20 n=1 Tax=Tremblaya princeps TaxID=189385 RepID=A0A143WR67_TREPR|nr:30S ribosomal protein S20 [Candidatus Tremblaya princeps]